MPASNSLSEGVEVEEFSLLEELLKRIPEEELRELAMESPRIRRAYWQRVSKANPIPGAAYEIAAAGLFESLICESDRGLVLVAAAIMDDELTDLFRAAFSMGGATEQESEFFLTRRPMPPLQSTSIKLRLAGALGFIRRPIMESGIALQDIRSSVAAHSKQHFELNKRHLDTVVSRFAPNKRAAFADLSKEMLPYARQHFATPEKMMFAYAAMSIIGEVREEREILDKWRASHEQSKAHSNDASDVAHG